MAFPGNHGIFDFAIEEYIHGYDVHMYDEDDCGIHGEGAAYDEVVEAINGRGQTNVAIMGYSHGGGSTYNLAWRLNENLLGNLTDITGAFVVPYTAYIDAITDYTAGAENRRPLLSMFHVNQYQLNSEVLTGGPAGGDDDDYGRTSDKDQAGAIQGENDLMPLVLQQIEPVGAGGEYRLSIPANVRVWQNDDRSGAVIAAGAPNESVFDAALQTILYVEGLSLGMSSITLDWVSQDGQYTGSDTVRLHVFEWVGPLNVPDHSIHTYTARGGNEYNSEWLDPVGGESREELNNDVIGEDGYGAIFGDLMKIKWNAGPIVGKPVYQAATDYVWDLDVNVVQVVVEPPDVGPMFACTTVDWFQELTGTEAGVSVSRIFSGPGSHKGFEWMAKVTLNGPLNDRGVTETRVGPVQNLEYTRVRGTYEDVGKTLKWYLEGEEVLDAAEGNVYYDQSQVFLPNKLPSGHLKKRPSS